MSRTNEFWQYTEEAILWASCAKSDEERRLLLDLAGTWTEAAFIERDAWVDSSPLAA